MDSKGQNIPWPGIKVIFYLEAVFTFLEMRTWVLFFEAQTKHDDLIIQSAFRKNNFGSRIAHQQNNMIFLNVNPFE